MVTEDFGGVKRDVAGMGSSIVCEVFVVSGTGGWWG